jgi:hypothetical protein
MKKHFDVIFIKKKLELSFYKNNNQEVRIEHETFLDDAFKRCIFASIVYCDG